MHYQTTNIRVESNTLKELKFKAVEEGRRVAELIREAIREYLQKSRDKVSAKSKKKDPLFSIIGLCQTGLRDGAEHHDRFLYGKAKK
ncbi:hypothetical protein COT42_07440 [Candidatus Saganbacteria bacterium CG08_land_8_20_14_0_20_45_16]|uniref:Ribbon-helix-helix protein CopG domain-containing protein n=1 Tax=Candidatus Saganbacteria bacterium CG08_land_8_20_14_0_20_45_16 TaxID=2014293 RepID=A0A2H0XWW0_UNCSA|nr:MAG: hypothetical protein COT42_07440 [Candidatus Saganbacteria bacterium CG08_land_8_20_14_0_20_45_16]